MKAHNYLLRLLILLLIFMSSCNSKSTDYEESIDKEVSDPKSSLNTVFDGKIFSIPSPVETSILIKNTKSPYTEALLNSPDNVSNYSDEVKKALNLGVYGTDMGYTIIYNQHSSSLKYLKCIEKITNDLDLKGAFDNTFMERFENNSKNQDSTVKLVSDAFQKADNFLKNNDRKNTSILILTGGWIESLYLACELTKISNNRELINRIGEQQQTLTTIIEILDLYNKNGVNDEILKSLEDLKLSFNLVKIEYDYVPPSVDEKKKTTTLNHGMEVILDSNVLNMITMRINKIRANIVY